MVTKLGDAAGVQECGTEICQLAAARGTLSKLCSSVWSNILTLVACSVVTIKKCFDFDTECTTSYCNLQKKQKSAKAAKKKKKR